MFINFQLRYTYTPGKPLPTFCLHNAMHVYIDRYSINTGFLLTAAGEAFRLCITVCYVYYGTHAEDYELEKNGAAVETHTTNGDSRGVVELSEELNGDSTEQKEEKESQKADSEE